MAGGNPMVDHTFIMINPEYNDGVAINEYKGTLSIVAVRSVGDDKRKFMRFCKPETGKNKFADSRIPMGSRLGNTREKAANVLLELAKKLMEAPAGDDTPF